MRKLCEVIIFLISLFHHHPAHAQIATLTGNVNNINTVGQAGGIRVLQVIYELHSLTPGGVDQIGCGPGILPRITGSGVALATTQWPYTPSGTGAMSGSIYRNDFIDCAGVTPTFYKVYMVNAGSKSLFGSFKIDSTTVVAGNFNFTTATGITGASFTVVGTGSAATVAVGTTTTGAPGTSASVANSGSPSAAVLNFTIPRGDVGATGATGATGSTGATGTAATVAVGTTTTLAAGSSATVSNSGSSSAATFNFGIPTGATGATGSTGATGTAATVAVGTTTTLAAGSSATVSNSGSSSAATFNFGIPTGATGPAGPQGGVVATVALSAQTAAITSTTMFTTITAGFYRFGGWISITTAGTGGNYVLSHVYTHDGTATTVSATSVNANSTNNLVQAQDVFYADASTTITYAVAANSITGSPQYRLNLSVEKLDLSFLASWSLSGQTAADAGTSLYTTVAAGFYRINGWISITTAGTGGSMEANVQYRHDGIGSNSGAQSFNLNVTSTLNFYSWSDVVYIDSGVNVQHGVFFSSVTGSPQYRYGGSIEKLF